jgi:hypothetical protein
MADDYNDKPVTKQKFKTSSKTGEQILASNRVRVIITHRKSSSWIDDLDAQQRLDQRQQAVFH